MTDNEFKEIIRSLDLPELAGINRTDIDFRTENVVGLISKTPSFQSPSSPVYKMFKNLLIVKYTLHYKQKDAVEEILGIKIDFPFLSMGAINSTHFFGIDELLIYDFYIRNRKRYSRVCDIGANVGLHSKILCELGFEVDSFEPDVTHSEICKEYLKNYRNNRFNQMAVSSYGGKAVFTKIINNTTGSFINDKKKTYGPIEKYEVDVYDSSLMKDKYDLIKMDIEGSELDVFKAFDESTFKNTDIIAEISTEETRNELWEFFKSIDTSVYSQKLGWNKIKSKTDLPTSHREGSIFVSRKNNWID